MFIELREAFNGKAGLGSSGSQEASQLEELARYRLLTSVDRSGFEAVASLVKLTLNVPMVAIELLPEAGLERLAAIGLPERRTDESGKCSMTRACIRREQPTVVTDLASSAEFSEHPLVCQTPFARSMASIPFRTSTGQWLGALHIFDCRPREFGEREINLLEKFVRIITDEVELYRSTAERERQQRLMQSIFDNAAVGISVNELGGRRIAVNDRYCELSGYSQEELLTSHIFRLTHPDDVDAGRVQLGRVLLGEIKSYQREVRWIKKTKEICWVKVSVSLIARGLDNQPYVVVITENIEERKQAEVARNLLLGEINHRVKNTLAIVQGIAKQLLRTTSSPAQFSTAFEKRVHALAKSHDMLTQMNWQALSLDQIIECQLAGSWELYRDQVTYTGSKVFLNPQATIMLGLIFNELLTNAVKHGALRAPAGQITIDGREEGSGDNNVVSIMWQENCEVPISAPLRQGLGSFLIERAPKLALSGEGTVEYYPKGITYHLRFPNHLDKSLT